MGRGTKPAPEGFEWSHINNRYEHPDGRWEDPMGNIHSPAPESVEQEIQRKGLVAPRVTPADVEAAIVDEEYFITEHSTLTVCVLTLRNGFTVTGESACASPANFDAELGRRIAKDKAKEKIWPLLGYALRDKLAATEPG